MEEYKEVAIVTKRCFSTNKNGAKRTLLDAIKGLIGGDSLVAVMESGVDVVKVVQ